jgi:hypothetical protein
MKKTLLVLIAIVVLANSCTKSTSDNEIDLVSGITPVHTLSSSQIATISSLREVESELRLQFLNEEWPTLANDIVFWVKSYPKSYPSKFRISNTSKIDSVVFSYGSGTGSGNDATAQTHSGKFDDRLLANIYIDSLKTPLMYFVECTNGMVVAVDSDGSIARIGQGGNNFEFVIEKGQGLCRYVSYESSIMLARTFEIPIYRGKIMSASTRISADEAIRLEDNTDREQITVKVFQGDRFNLNTMVYTPAK